MATFGAFTLYSPRCVLDAWGGWKLERRVDKKEGWLNRRPGYKEGMKRFIKRRGRQKGEVEGWAVRRCGLKRKGRDVDKE